MRERGIISIDDGYIEDDSSYSQPQIRKKQELLFQTNNAGMMLVDEVIARKDDKVIGNYDMEYGFLVNRCSELMAQHPEKADLFSNYIKTQEQEYDNLKSKITCNTMVFKQKEQDDRIA